jgi:dCTP deaminase
MILTGPEIEAQHDAGRIWITPFERESVQPNSYDFRLGDTLVTYVNHTLDAGRENECISWVIPPEGVVLRPEKIYLGHTVERMGSNYYVPIIRGKSSIARLGLFVHVTADLIDLGSHNQWTLQLRAVQPVRVFAGMRIGQVTFWKVEGERVLYNGKYQGSTGPVPSRSYLDLLGHK